MSAGPGLFQVSMRPGGPAGIRRGCVCADLWSTGAHQLATSPSRCGVLHAGLRAHARPQMSRMSSRAPRMALPPASGSQARQAPQARWLSATADDLYLVLGVGRTASQKEIKGVRNPLPTPLRALWREVQGGGGR